MKSCCKKQVTKEAKQTIATLKKFLTAEHEGSTIMMPEYYSIKKELRL